MSEQRRILVLANETCAGAAVCEEVGYRARGRDASVLVVAPVLIGSRVGHWLNAGSESARTAAKQRLHDSVAAMRAAGLLADGQLGDADPMQALDDAFRTFAPHEIVISTHPPARSHWLERRVVQRARERYEVPVTHVVVDLAHEAATTLSDPRPGPRVPRATTTLYRACDYDEALAVQTKGFVNGREPDGRSGVRFTDAPDPPTGIADPTVFVVGIPTASLEPYEVRTDGGAREWVLPAELVNRHGPLALVSDWSE